MPGTRSGARRHQRTPIAAGAEGALWRRGEDRAHFPDLAEETGQGLVVVPSIEAREMQECMVAAELSAAENLARAERAEFREQAHQDHWAIEVDRLRQAALAQSGSAATTRALQEQVLRLTAELNAARAVLAERG